jgi:hypothetical protein
MDEKYEIRLNDAIRIPSGSPELSPNFGDGRGQAAAV